MKIIVNVLVIIFLITLQWAVLPSAGFSFLLPPLILPVAIAWAEAGRAFEAMVWGTCGLLVGDLITASSGKMAVAGILAFAICYFGIRYLIHFKGRLYVLACAFAASLVYFLALFFEYYFLGLNVWQAFFSTMLPSACLAILAWLAFPMLQGSARLVEILEAGRKSFLR